MKFSTCCFFCKRDFDEHSRKELFDCGISLAKGESET